MHSRAGRPRGPLLVLGPVEEDEVVFAFGPLEGVLADDVAFNREAAVGLLAVLAVAETE